jgi:hypothetical protein
MVDDCCVRIPETVEKFVIALVRDQLARAVNNEIVTTAHDIGGVKFYFVYRSMSDWGIAGSGWSLNTTWTGIAMRGDEKIYIRDMTMLMMAVDVA